MVVEVTEMEKFINTMSELCTKPRLLCNLTGTSEAEVVYERQ